MQCLRAFPSPFSQHRSSPASFGLPHITAHTCFVSLLCIIAGCTALQLLRQYQPGTLDSPYIYHINQLPIDAMITILPSSPYNSWLDSSTPLLCRHWLHHDNVSSYNISPPLSLNPAACGVLQTLRTVLRSVIILVQQST